jgi:predicted  nucleic acid-binding Zn-ribbon protein
MDENNFEKMVLDLRQRISVLQVPAVKSLTPEDFSLLRKDRELRSKSANYRTLGENERADALESEILNLQSRVTKIKEKLAQTPSGQQEIFNTIAATPDSELHQLALKIYAVGLKEFEKLLKEIEASEQELKSLHDALAKNAEARAGFEGRKVNLYLKLRELEKCLPVEERKVQFPPRAPEWSHFLPDEGRIGRAYGPKPILFRD